MATCTRMTRRNHLDIQFQFHVKDSHGCSHKMCVSLVRPRFKKSALLSSFILQNQIIESKRVLRSEGEKLRGKLLFACGQLFGRRLRNRMRILSTQIQSNRSTLCGSTNAALMDIRTSLAGNVPRRLTGYLTDYLHAYVDVFSMKADTQALAGQ